MKKLLLSTLPSRQDDGHLNRRLTYFILHDENGIPYYLEMLEVNDLFIFRLIFPSKENTDKAFLGWAWKTLFCFNYYEFFV